MFATSEYVLGSSDALEWLKHKPRTSDHPIIMMIMLTLHVSL